MRTPRVKPDYRDSWHHCTNRAAGTKADRPFGDAEKEAFIRILQRVSAFYTVRVVAYTVMSNHFHLLLHVPAAPPTEEETCARFLRHHGGKRKLTPGTALCRTWQARLRDLSWFMHAVERQFSCWFNRTRPVRRRGTLWAGRFHNTLLEEGQAVWACWAYLELNPWRGGLVRMPGDYRFCSWGTWVQRGRHPFEENARRWLLPAVGAAWRVSSLTELQRVFGEKLAEMTGLPPPGHPWSARVRYWGRGLVIGSELFVREVMARVRGRAVADRQHLAADVPAPEAPLYAWNRPRCVAE